MMSAVRAMADVQSQSKLSLETATKPFDLNISTVMYGLEMVGDVPDKTAYKIQILIWHTSSQIHARECLLVLSVLLADLYKPLLPCTNAERPN
jgi:hypothetical protein